MAKDIEMRIVGPINLDYEELGDYRKRTGFDHTKKFWDDPMAANVATKEGIYIFALVNPQGYMAYYVGQTKRTFDVECFAADKLLSYNEVLIKPKRGKPVMFFIVKTGGGKGVIDEKVLDTMEKELIAKAAKRNDELINLKHTKGKSWFIPTITVPKKGRSTSEQKKLRAMLGF